MFIALVLFVALYGVFSTAIVRQLDDERFKYRENFVWAVFHVQRQFLVVHGGIEAALGRVGLTDDAVDEVLLEYEILVSRVYLLRDGDGFEILFTVPEVAEAIKQLEVQIDQIDAAIAEINDPEEKLTVLYSLLEPMNEDLQQAVVRTTNFVSVYNANNISVVKRDIQILSYLFFVGVIVMVALGGFMIRQRQKIFAADMAAQKARQEQEVIEEAADYAKMHALGTLAGGVAVSYTHLTLPTIYSV